MGNRLEVKSANETWTPGTSVNFVLRDVLHPELEQVLGQVGPDLLVSGEITYLSDGGACKDQFAVVAVAGMAAPVIVPVEALQVSAAELPGEMPIE